MRSISIISARNRRLAADLKIIRKRIFADDPATDINYFMLMLNAKSKSISNANEALLEQFIKDHGNETILSVDGSLTEGCLPLIKEKKSVLLASPYNYQFDNRLRMEEGRECTLSALPYYKNIFVFSPFFKEVLTKGTDVSGCNVIEGYASPYACNVNDAAYQTAAKDALYKRFPDSRGKQIYCIFVSGRIDEEKFSDERYAHYRHTNLKSILKEFYDNNKFLITNNPLIVENAIGIPAKYRKCFGYIGSWKIANGYVAAADALMTNEAQLFTAGCAKRIPVMGLAYNNNGFEKYMASHHGDIFADQANKIGDLLTQSTDRSRKDIWEYYSYLPKEDSVSHIVDFLS